MKGRLVAAVGAAVVLSGFVPGSLAGAASTSTGGPVKVWVKPSTATTSVKHPGKIIFTGAIGDYGTTTNANATGKPTKKGTYKFLTLKKGTILATGATLNEAVKTAFTKPTLNMTNCSVSASATGAVHFVKGTGAYVGISGSVTITLSYAGVLPKTKSGSCTEKTATKPLAFYSSVMGSGTVSFS